MKRRAIYLIRVLVVCGCSTQLSAAPTAEQQNARLAEAKRLFAEGCKRSGEVIRRTVPNVEGILLLKLRPTDYSPYNQNAVDPYGYDFDWGYKDKPQPYISTFLIGRDGKGNLVDRDPASTPGYRYVEAIDQGDGKRYRYTGSRKVVGRKNETARNVQINLQQNPNYDLNLYDFVVERVPALSDAPRYGITYDDISTRDEREHWIAGSSLKVIDLKTDEVIAERIGYMVDLRLGETPSGRQPWTFARWNKGWSCPDIHRQSYGARRFVEKVLLIRNAQPIVPADAAR